MGNGAPTVALKNRILFRFSILRDHQVKGSRRQHIASSIDVRWLGYDLLPSIYDQVQSLIYRPACRSHIPFIAAISVHFARHNSIRKDASQYDPGSEEFALLDSQEYSLNAWPAHFLPATPHLRVHCPANKLRPGRVWESFIHFTPLIACAKEQVSRPPSQSHNYKAAKDQCNPMNPLPRCRTMKAFNPSSSGYHAADPSVSQQ